MKRFVAIALAGILSVAAPAGAEETDRLASEAADLFRVVLAAEATPTRCQYGTDWLTEPVPEYIARKYLGLTLHAELSAPFQMAHVQEILDPHKKFATAFCNSKETRAYEKAQFDAFEQNKSANMVRIERVQFSFPIFDAAYRKAVVVIDRSGLQRDRLTSNLGAMKPGDIMRHPLESVEVANVFIKTTRGWKLIARKLIGQS